MTQEPTKNGKIEVTLDYMKRDIQDIKNMLKDDYVTHDEFEPIKKVVYGLVAIILTSVVGAIVALVVTK